MREAHNNIHCRITLYPYRDWLEGKKSSGMELEGYARSKFRKEPALQETDSERQSIATRMDINTRVRLFWSPRAPTSCRKWAKVYNFDNNMFYNTWNERRCSNEWTEQGQIEASSASWAFGY